MATVNIKFRRPKIEEDEGVIYYQIKHKKSNKIIITKHRLYVHEWDSYENLGNVSTPGKERKVHILKIKNKINNDILSIKSIISSLDGLQTNYDASTIAKIFKDQLYDTTLFVYMQELISKLSSLDRVRTSETYKSTLNSFMRFRNGVDIIIKDITSNLMMEYEAYLKSQNVTKNTISFYMRILRAVYNRAVEQNYTGQRSPFKRVYTGIDKTTKRSLLLREIKRIKALNLSQHRDLSTARDLFLFSFYTRGMSFVDMAYLKKEDINGGKLSYNRRKTGKQLHIKWEKCMQDIVDNYSTNKTQYLLPIIKDSKKSELKQYRSGLSAMNNKLKKIAQMAKIETPLSMYVARHSWASVAKSKYIPISVISEGMGHDSESTTKIYLASLDTTVIDKANRLILKLL